MQELSIIDPSVWHICLSSTCSQQNQCFQALLQVGHCRNHDVPLDDILLESTVEWTSNTALDSQWVPDEAITALLEICSQPAGTPAKESSLATPPQAQ